MDSKDFSHMLDGWRQMELGMSQLKAEVTALRMDNATLRSDNALLRAALKPFADIASKLRGDATDWSFFANGDDLRAAAAALEETSDE